MARPPAQTEDGAESLQWQMPKPSRRLLETIYDLSFSSSLSPLYSRDQLTLK